MTLGREPVIGEVLAGKYEVRGVLGRGGMGIVVSAWHRELSQKVAIKYLLPEALLSSEVVERFAREARAAAQVRGEHVVRILDVGKLDDGRPFMVMEHLEGHDLSVELARQGRLSVGDAVRCVIEACEALAQAHAARIVHRDLKPSNLFLADRPGRAPTIKVLDFGISKFVEPETDAITKTSAIIGTAHYMSPEQLLAAKSVDERSDLWSLGIILYQLLIGEPPFVGESAPAIIAKIIQNTPTPPRARRDDLPPELDAVILKCLRTAPGQRFADVGELATALLPFGAPEDAERVAAITRVLAASSRPRTEPTTSASLSMGEMPTVAAATGATSLEGASTITEMAAPPSVTRRRRHRGVAIVGAVAVVVAGAGAIVVRSRPVDPPVVGAPATPPSPSIVATPAPIDPPGPSASVVETPPVLSVPPVVHAPAPTTSARGPRPRPLPTAHASASAAPTASAPPRATNADPLDIPLR